MYLLSNGKTTLNKLDYVSDVLRIEFNLRISDIPSSTYGSDNLIRSYDKENVESRLSQLCEEIIQKVVTDTDTNIELESFEIVRNTVLIVVKIENLTKTYEIN